MGTIGSLALHLARLLPDADENTLRRLERAAAPRTFRRRDLLHPRGLALPPSVVLDGHVILRRVVETGQVRAALIAGPGYLGGLRSISDPEAEAFYELVALTDGTWATWDPRFLRGLALEDAGLAVGLLDHIAYELWPVFVRNPRSVVHRRTGHAPAARGRPRPRSNGSAAG